MREAMKDKLYEREVWRGRERGVSGYNEVYGGGWIMRRGERVRVQGEER